MGKYRHDIVTVNVFYSEKRGTVHSDPLSDELPSERKWLNVFLLPAAAQPGQRRVPQVFKLGEGQLVEDVINSGPGSHLPQKYMKC